MKLPISHDKYTRMVGLAAIDSSSLCGYALRLSVGGDTRDQIGAER
jgi:hypothetical protein